MSNNPGDFTDRPDDVPRPNREFSDREPDRERNLDYDRYQEREGDFNRDKIDIRRKPEQQQDLTGVDWALCVLCPGIACIVGIVRVCSGNPTGGKMIGMGVLFGVLWNVLSFLVQMGKH